MNPIQLFPTVPEFLTFCLSSSQEYNDKVSPVSLSSSRKGAPSHPQHRPCPHAPMLTGCAMRPLSRTPQVRILLTTGSPAAYALLKEALPSRVTVQLVPLDTPLCIALFMQKWRPQVGIVMVSR